MRFVVGEDSYLAVALHANPGMHLYSTKDGKCVGSLVRGSSRDVTALVSVPT